MASRKTDGASASTFILIVLWPAFLCAGSTDVVSVSTGEWRREFVIENGVVRTRRFVNASSKLEWHIDKDADEFELRLTDGRIVTNRDFVATVSPDSIANNRAQVRLMPREQPTGLPEVVLECEADQSSSVIRKSIRTVGDAEIDTIVVESLGPVTRSTGGGLGQPVFVNDGWFIGVEYPGAENRVTAHGLKCMHFPGRSHVVSRTSVVGCIASVNQPVSEAFLRYLTIWRGPKAIRPRGVLQFNGWFDQRGGTMTPDSMLATFETFQEQLLRPYQLRFDAFVIDDGYQHPQSLWEPTETWKIGLPLLRDRLARDDSRLGLWLPLTGYLLDTRWGAHQGLETTVSHKSCYCLGGEHYRHALASALDRRIEEGNLAYLKHDFNFLACRGAGHGHLATDRHGREANVDGLLTMLAHERVCQPDILLSLTSNIWLSPWWLRDADFLWMGGADYGHDWANPVTTHRQAEMTYRDGLIYERLRVQHSQVPVSAIMTHGLIRGRFEGIHQDETLRDWADYVAMFLGRGTFLHELYLSPSLMPADYWPVLGQLIQWAHSNGETLRHTQMIGGDPRRGEPYGYIHWSAHHGIVCLRNPRLVPTIFGVTTAERPTDLPVIEEWQPTTIYPGNRTELAIKAPTTLHVELQGGEVRIIEFSPHVLQAARASGPETRRLPALSFLNDAGTEKKQSERHVLIPPLSTSVHAELVVDIVPATGMAVDVELREASGAAIALNNPQIVRPADHRGWERQVWQLPAATIPRELLVRATLPVGPRWPEKAAITGVVNLYDATSASTHSIGHLNTASTDNLIHERWDIGESFVIFDHVVLTRRRSRIESAAWIGILFAVPGLAAIGLTRWIARRWPSVRPAAALVAALVFVSVFALTPLGRWLQLALASAHHHS